MSEEKQKLLYCSFCGKSQHEVRKLVAGPSVFICDDCVKIILSKYAGKEGEEKDRDIELLSSLFEDIRDEIDINEDFERIVRSIEFPPEYYHSGMTILSNFAKIIRTKYSDKAVKVSIQQDNKEVLLVIESEERVVEKIKETMRDYSLVLTGEMLPEEFSASQLEVVELKTQLRIAHVQLEAQKDILQLERNAGERADSQLKSLEQKYSEVTDLLKDVLRDKSEENRLLLNGLKSLSRGQSLLVKESLKLISTRFEIGLDEEDEESVKKALVTVHKENPKLFDKVNNVLLGAVSGAGGQFLHQWLTAVNTVLPK